VTIRAEPVLQLAQAYLHMKLADYDAAADMLALTQTLLESASPKIKRDFLIISVLHRGYIDDLAAVDCASTFEAQVEALDPADHLGRGTLLATVAVAALAAGDVDHTDAVSRRAIQEMRGAGSVLGTNYCFLHLAQGQLLRGRLREAESLFREAMVMAEDNFGKDSGLKALSGTFLSYCLYLRNDLEGSSVVLDSSLDSIETADRFAVLVAPILLVFGRIAGPLVSIIERSSKRISLQLGLKGDTEAGGGPHARSICG